MNFRTLSRRGPATLVLPSSVRRNSPGQGRTWTRLTQSSSVRARSGWRSRARWPKAAAKPSSWKPRPAIGQGVSSRNSEVIHAGLYYAPGSLKARLCVRGKELLYEMCASHGVSHRRCGKLVVAMTEAEALSLRTLQQRAAANGVPVQWLDGAQAHGLEPALRLRGGPAVAQHRHRGQPRLHAGAAGRLRSGRRHGRAGLAGRLGGAGAAAARRIGSAWRTAANRGPRAGQLGIAARLRLARRFEGLDAAHVPREYFAKGNYLRADRQGAVFAADLSGPGRCLAGRAPDPGPGRPGQVRARPGMAGCCRAGRHRLPGRPAASGRLLREGPALLAAASRWRAAAQLQRRAAEDPRAGRERRPISASTGRRCTACRGWSTCSESNRPDSPARWPSPRMC